MTASGIRDSAGPQLPDISSNALDIEILPRDEVWAAEQLTSTGVHTLRSLETEAAAHLLAKSFGRKLLTDDEIFLALWSSPHRALIIADLERNLAEPSYESQRGTEKITTIE